MFLAEVLQRPRNLTCCTSHPCGFLCQFLSRVYQFHPVSRFLLGCRFSRATRGRQANGYDGHARNCGNGLASRLRFQPAFAFVEPRPVQARPGSSALNGNLRLQLYPFAEQYMSRTHRKRRDVCATRGVGQGAGRRRAGTADTGVHGVRRPARELIRGHPAEEARVVQAVERGIEAGGELALHLARIIAELRNSALPGGTEAVPWLHAVPASPQFLHPSGFKSSFPPLE